MLWPILEIVDSQVMTRVPLLAREIRSGPRANRSEVDTPKKLIYSSFCGEAVSDVSVTGLLNAVKAACAFMKPGFIGLTEF